MADYPYTTVPGKIKKLFDKLTKTGIPQKATPKWLKGIGFTSSNDGTLLRILTFIGFTDSSGIPTDEWKQFRGSHGKQVLARCIKTAYAELFSTYPTANDRSRSELESFFSIHSSAGKPTIGKTVSTFQKLCELADFDATTDQGKAAATAEQAEDEADIGDLMTAASKSYKGFTVNINIQLTLPETTDAKAYDAFFSAMKKHLLQGDV